MKNYVITMQDVPLARAMAERCVRSGSFHGVWIDYFTATTPNNSDIYKMLKEEGISALGFEEVYSRLDNCIAAFLSHYRIWKLAAETNTSVTIFEHDAVIKAPIRPVPFNMCLNLGKPSYGKFNTPQSLGVGPLVSKRYFGGAHAYRLTARGANQLVTQAKQFARPTDVFLHLDTFPHLEEMYPWPVEVEDSFSTIQKTEGCLAKHNYGADYEII